MRTEPEAAGRQRGATSSAADQDGYYALNVDAREAPAGESLFEVAERLINSEIENARQLLERLWSMRKNANAANAGSLGELIERQQQKLNALRSKEDHIHRLSELSRRLLQDQQLGRNELGSLRKEIRRGLEEIEELSARVERLRAREEELDQGRQRFAKMLEANEREIVSSIYSLLMAGEARDVPQRAEQKASTASPESAAGREPAERLETAAPRAPEAATAASAAENVQEVTKTVRYAKSVVRTTGGRILAEYYYDASTEKARRHYILNSKYFLEELSAGLRRLKQEYSRDERAELLQMVQDAHNRVSQSSRLHFEAATIEVLNHQNLRRIWQELREKSYGGVERFCTRLRARLAALGHQYHRVLVAQMDNLRGS